MQAQGALESLLLFFDQLHALRELEKANCGGANPLKSIQLQEDCAGLRHQIFQHLPVLEAGKEGNHLADADLKRLKEGDS